MIGLLNRAFFMLAEAEIIYPDGTVESVSAGATSNWPSAAVIVLSALLGLVCAALIVVILLQKKRASGIGAAIAGSGETYFSKNKGKTLEGTLENYTKWGGALFVAVALLINILM